jgi:hypothetical protein
MPNSLTALSPLLEQVSWRGQEYFTSQHFHRQYLTDSPHGGKYQRHGDFLRVLRNIPAYSKYVSHGDVVEVSWNRVKSEGTQDSLSFQPLFQAAGWNPLTLLNATAQVALTHHLDNETSQQISVAANTTIARQATRKPNPALPEEIAVRIARAMNDLGSIFGTPLHIVQQETAKQIETKTGLNVQPFLLAAPAQDNIAPEEKMLEPTDLAKALGLTSGYALNRTLEEIGWQVKRIGGGWEPTPTGAPYVTQHAWVRGSKTGYNLKWNEQAVTETLHAHNLLAEES